MIVVRDPRHLFIDESGDSERTLLLCALSLPESTVALAEASTDRLVGRDRSRLSGPTSCSHDRRSRRRRKRLGAQLRKRLAGADLTRRVVQLRIAQLPPRPAME